MALNTREKLLLGGLTFIGGLLVAYTFVHEPLTTRRAEARETVRQVEGDLGQERRKLSKEGDLEGRKAKVTVREQTVDSWVPGKNSAALLVWHLSQAEQLSGVQISAMTAGEKSVVNVAEDKAGDQGAGGKAGGKAPGNSGQTVEQQAAMATLVVVPLEIKVDGKFAEHLIFNQYIEDAPLFLNTYGIQMARQGNLPIEKAGQLVQSGNPWLAGQVLSQSPAVDGVYRVNLYFKADKPGPSTDEMRFGSQPGRIDPFVMDAVDEFIRWVQAYFAGQGAGDGRLPPPGPTTPPQLG